MIFLVHEGAVETTLCSELLHPSWLFVKNANIIYLGQVRQQTLQ